MRISDWSSDVCSSDLHHDLTALLRRLLGPARPFQLAGALGRCVSRVRKVLKRKERPVNVIVAVDQKQLHARNVTELPDFLIVFPSFRFIAARLARSEFSCQLTSGSGMIRLPHPELPGRWWRPWQTNKQRNLIYLGQHSCPCSRHWVALLPNTNP